MLHSVCLDLIQRYVPSEMLNKPESVKKSETVQNRVPTYHTYRHVIFIFNKFPTASGLHQLKHLHF